MVRDASRTLKIGVHSPFDLNFDLGGGTFYPQKFRQAYCTGKITFMVIVLVTFKGNHFYTYLSKDISQSLEILRRNFTS